MSAENDFVREETRNIGIVLERIRELLAKPQWNAYELAAMGTFLHNAYSGVERILRCRLTTETQHAAFFDLLQFRHFYVHGYAHQLDETRIRQIAKPVPPVISEFLSGGSPL